MKGKESNLHCYLAGSGSAVNTTHETLRIQFTAQYRDRPTYEAGFMAGAAVGEDLIGQLDTSIWGVQRSLRRAASSSD